MITFPVSDVTPSPLALPPLTAADSLAARLGAPVEAAGANLPLCVPEAGSGRAPAPHHGFVAAVHHAFAHHLPLALSPDDVWLCIAQGFAAHVEVNAEALRSRFVRHEGEVLIRVQRDAFVKGSPDNDWPGCFAEFSARIAEHIGKKRDLVIADFSTTGPAERAASEIVLMSAMRRYFRYEVFTMCGIPRVTLLGTPDDWRAVRRRAEVLAEFDLRPWTKALLPVLDKVIASAEGRPDQGFWRSFYKFKESSGGPYVNGWINTLFPYLQPEGSEGGVAAAPVPNDSVAHWASSFDVPFGGGPRPEMFPLGLSRAPFVWEHLAERLSMEFIGGFVGIAQTPETGAVRPAIGWAVRPEPPLSPR